MRRAMLTMLITGVLLSGATSTTRSQQPIQPRTSMNAIGLLDYSQPPRWKVGDWVRYQMTGSSQMGMRDDYVLTVLIAADEEWWGERCFWVETWQEPRSGPPQTVATCMSYDIFGDSLAIPRLQMYQRKTITTLNPQGEPRQEVTKRNQSSLRTRNLNPRPMMWDVDTTGTDTVVTPRGTLAARVVVTRQGTGATVTVGDSSRYDEVRENRTTWHSEDVPLTRVAREDIETTISRRTWMVGRSGEGTPLLVRERGLGSARVIDWGSGGLKPRLLPAYLTEPAKAPRPTAAAPPRARSPRRR